MVVGILYVFIYNVNNNRTFASDISLLDYPAHMIIATRTFSACDQLNQALNRYVLREIRS